ncbi:MAG: hypothetical protein JKY88_02625 [Pseudomonadales bacterium]|nr:hypothetical protein [Pseudomonadales bacterium]
MSILKRQTTLGKSLYEINTNTVKELVSLQRDNVQQYFDVNKDFGSRISEIKGVTGFVNLQKEYNQTLWNNAKGAVVAQNEIVKDAFIETQDAVKLAFVPVTESTEAASEEVAEEAPVKAKPKAKAKKSTAKAA